MRARTSAIVLWLSLICVASIPTLVSAEDGPSIARARELWQLLASGQYEQFVAAGTEQVRKQFPAEQAEALWGGLAFQLGQYESIAAAKLTKVQGYDAVSLTCKYERGTATIRVVLDAEGAMAGLRIDGVTQDKPYEPPPYVKLDSFREEQVIIRCDGFELPAKLVLPKKPGPFPAVVLVHGSGPQDEDETVGANKPFRDLAWGLASQGIATLRYEKRTHKYPTAIDAKKITFNWETINDALAAAELLRKHPEVDAKRVFVVGHSLGAMAAPFIAQRDRRLAGIVLIAGNARPLLDVIEEQIEYLAKLDGEFSDEERLNLEGVKQATAAIRAGKLDEVKKPLLGAPSEYWAHMHTFDPTVTAAKLTLPIFVIHGGRDYQITRAEHVLWKEKLAGRENVTLKLYDKLNHLMIPGQGKPDPAEYQRAGHVDARVIKDIADWIEAR